MNGELLIVLEHLEREKGIDRQVLIDAIESSLLTASKKRLGKTDNITVCIDPRTAEVQVFEKLSVVKEVVEPGEQISLEEAKKINPKAKVGTEITREITPEDFGRIAAQTAKQVIIQKIREAEREIVYTEFKDRVGDIVNGIIRRNERGNVIVDIGRTEAVLPYKEQSSHEEYRNGFRMRFYILDVRVSSRGPEVVLSRTHPGLVRRLFELEVPEINEGSVSIKGIAREPGYRSKISVESQMEKVDSVGACVGLRGERVKNIVRELNGEKIDIVRYSNNTSMYVENALSPAKIDSIKLNEKKKSMQIIVPEDQFSLAIGKKGQNARLTSKLIGWKIDIKKKGELLDDETEESVSFDSIPDVPQKICDAIIEAGYSSVESLKYFDEESIKEIKGVGEKSALKIIEAIRKFINKEQSKTKLDSILAEKSKELQNTK
ncbi:MAG: transcription termination factor NusA [Candidatus Auribacterota bacterium]|jgi:N utilization substance protein A|nr:transcription termination factor NusA [Candidatus Auribacterota bacterium]